VTAADAEILRARVEQAAVRCAIPEVLLSSGRPDPHEEFEQELHDAREQRIREAAERPVLECPPDRHHFEWQGDWQLCTFCGVKRRWDQS